MTVLERRAQPAIVTLPNQIDEARAEGVYEELRAACGPGVTVVADMTATRFCHSTGIRNITLADEQAKTMEGQLRLALPEGVVHRVLELLGLDKVLLVYPTMDAAMNGHAAAGGHPTGQVQPTS